MTEEKVWENIEEVVEPFYKYGFESAYLSGSENDFVLDLYYTFDFGHICLVFPFDGTAKGFCQAAWEIIGSLGQFHGMGDDLNKALTEAFGIVLNEQEEA